MKSTSDRSDSLIRLGAVEAIAAMKDGTLSAQAYATALLEQAEAMCDLNAFISLDIDRVLADARKADERRAAGKPLGLLHGLPIPIKDSMNTRHTVTTNGTRALRDFCPDSDAGLVRRLLDQGAIIMGKTNMTELSFGWTSNNEYFGPVRNPFNKDHVPGGSSGGAAAAVAGHVTPLATAADTLGSIRVPASFCGLVGMRPTFGRYPNDGAFALTIDKLDQTGALARRVADLRLFDQAVTGQRPSGDIKLEGVRIGTATFYENDLAPDTECAYRGALSRLRNAGATLVPTEPSEILRSAFETSATIMLYEAILGIGRYLDECGAHVTVENLLASAGTNIRRMIEHAAMPPHRPSRRVYLNALRQRSKIRAALPDFFAEHNISALTFPATATAAPAIGEENDVDINGRRVSFFEAFGRNTALGPAAGAPSLVLPTDAGSKTSLPVGIEFLALPGRDQELLSLGLAIEAVLLSCTKV